jgi:hypothetical protein
MMDYYACALFELTVEISTNKIALRPMDAACAEVASSEF